MSKKSDRSHCAKIKSRQKEGGGPGLYFLENSRKGKVQRSGALYHALRPQFKSRHPSCKKGLFISSETGPEVSVTFCSFLSSLSLSLSYQTKQKGKKKKISEKDYWSSNYIGRHSAPSGTLVTGKKQNEFYRTLLPADQVPGPFRPQDPVFPHILTSVSFIVVSTPNLYQILH